MKHFGGFQQNVNKVKHIVDSYDNTINVGYYVNYPEPSLRCG